MSCGIGHRYGSNPWQRLAAIAPIWPLAQELPYATGVALKKKKKKKKNVYNKDCAILTIFKNIRFGDITYIHSVVQHLPLLETFQTFSSAQMETVSIETSGSFLRFPFFIVHEIKVRKEVWNSES